MRPTGSPQVLEARRQIAARLFERGMSLTDIATAVGASVSSVHRWHEAWRHGGKLRSKPHPGPKPKLSKSQKRRLVQALLKGTHHWGYAVSGWTGPVVRDLIQRMFGVVHHADHIPRLLRGLGWSPQKPVQRARERDEERIARWKREDWPRIKKEPRSAS